MFLINSSHKTAAAIDEFDESYVGVFLLFFVLNYLWHLFIVKRRSALCDCTNFVRGGMRF